MRSLIVSDVHLCDLGEARDQHFFNFLKSKAEQYERLYVLGDLFDVWPGSSPLLIQKFKPIFEFFRSYSKNGGQVHYIEGNHDFQLGKALEQEYGFKLYLDEIREVWGDQKILLCHGDTVNPLDVNYHHLRRFFRSPWFRLVRRTLPDRVGVKLGTTASRMSRESQLKRPDRFERLDRVRERYRVLASGLFDQGHDVVVMGHTHIPENFSVDKLGKTHRYLNSGDWVQNFTYITYDSGQFELQQHPMK